MVSGPSLLLPIYLTLLAAIFWHRISTAKTLDDFQRIGAMSQYALVVVIFWFAVWRISLFEGPSSLSPMCIAIMFCLSFAAFFLRRFEFGVIIVLGLLSTLIDHLQFQPRNIPISVAFWISLAVGASVGHIMFKKFFGARVNDAIARSKLGNTPI